MVNQCRLPQPLKAAMCFRQKPHLVPIASHAGCAGGGGRRLHTGAAGGVPGGRPRRRAGRHAPPAAGGAAVRRHQVHTVFPAIFFKRLLSLHAAPSTASRQRLRLGVASCSSGHFSIRKVCKVRVEGSDWHCTVLVQNLQRSTALACSWPRKCFQVECQANDILSVMSQAALCGRCRQAGRDALPGAARSVRCQIRHHFQGADPTMLVQSARKFGALGRQTTSVTCCHAAHDMQNCQLQGCHMSPPNPRS